MSEAFRTETSSHIPVQPLQGFLQIECADGEFLLYSGYMKVDITAAGVGQKEKQAQPCLLLVASESRYNAKVPLLLETNSLERFLDTSVSSVETSSCKQRRSTPPGACPSAPWSSEKKELLRRKNRLEIVKLVS